MAIFCSLVGGFSHQWLRRSWSKKGFGSRGIFLELKGRRQQQRICTLLWSFSLKKSIWVFGDLFMGSLSLFLYVQAALADRHLKLCCTGENELFFLFLCTQDWRHLKKRSLSIFCVFCAFSSPSHGYPDQTIPHKVCKLRQFSYFLSLLGIPTRQNCTRFVIWDLLLFLSWISRPDETLDRTVQAL